MEYFIEPVKSDCEDLLSRFQRTESVRYEEFAAIWRKMDFPSIFYGKMAANEMRAFSRLVMTTAFPYVLPPYNFQIRVGGLYLLYALYNTQLAVPKEKITIALKDWESIMRFQQDAVNSQHYDVCYVFRKLLSDKAVFFAAMPKPLSFQVKRKPKRHLVCEAFRDRPARVKDLITTETLEEVSNVQEHYEKVKAAITASRGQSDPAISLINKDLGACLQDTVMTYQNWLDEVTGKRTDSGDATDPGEGTSKQGDSSRRAELLASIKSKSYGQLTEASKSRRHRQVEMDMFASETKHTPGVRVRNRMPSLKARTKKNLLNKGNLREEILQATKQWHLSVAEQDKPAKPRDHKRFKYSHPA